MPRLTDGQCNKFRRMPGSFNDMVNGIFEAGRMAGAQECVEVCRDELFMENRLVSDLNSGHDTTSIMNAATERCIEMVEKHFDFKASE